MNRTRIGNVAEMVLKKEVGGLTLSDIKIPCKATVCDIGCYWRPREWNRGQKHVCKYVKT